MKFEKSSAQIFIPDGIPDNKALMRTTHIALVAHQDDIEIIAVDGVLQCFHQQDKWFTGVTVTNGSGSARSGVYENYSDKDMRAIRLREQKKAAIVGEYCAQILLDYPSSEIKDNGNKGPLNDITSILEIACPEVVYTHNLADKHETHIAVAMRVIEALRILPESKRPLCVYGCEAWRDLDWLSDEDKVAFDCSSHENLQAALLGIFDSQIAGGKRYDLATMGRRKAHATYRESHSTDISTGMIYAMDLTPLIQNPGMDIALFIQEQIRKFENETLSLIRKFSS